MGLCSSWLVASYADCIADGFADRRVLALSHFHYRQVYCSSVARPRVSHPREHTRVGPIERTRPFSMAKNSPFLCVCVCVFFFLGGVGRAMHSSNQMADSAPRRCRETKRASFPAHFRAFANSPRLRPNRKANRRLVQAHAPEQYQP